MHKTLDSIPTIGVGRRGRERESEDPVPNEVKSVAWSLCKWVV
jgi:hypothetical protein